MRTGRAHRGWGCGRPTDPRLRRLHKGLHPPPEGPAGRPRPSRALPHTDPECSPLPRLRRGNGPRTERRPAAAGRRGRSRPAHLGAEAEVAPRAPLAARDVPSSCARAGAPPQPLRPAPSGALGFRGRSERKEGPELVGAGRRASGEPGGGRPRCAAPRWRPRPPRGAPARRGRGRPGRGARRGRNVREVVVLPRARARGCQGGVPALAAAAPVVNGNAGEPNCCG